MDNIAIRLDPKSGTPMYLQLHNYLAAEIAAGRIKEGERLPGKRTAAAALGVSLSTVDGAYQLLASEGYVTARPRSGFTACRIEPISPPVFSPVPPVRPDRAEKIADTPEYSFLTGGIETAFFPFRTWGKLFKDTLYNRPDLLNHGDPMGDEGLREAISLYLRHSRGVICGPGKIIVGAGMEYLLGLLCHLLRGRRIAVEDPGYAKIYRILVTYGMEVGLVPVDDMGIIPEILEKDGAEAVYLTPSHQFPTGAVTPAGRRSRLIKWACRGRYIIEDDYDSEFRFDGRPMPSMQALAPDRVIYIGTFSRTIAPAIRVAYMVLPDELMEKYNSDFRFFSNTVSRFEQQTLRRYIEEGHFGRSLSRARGQYRRRRDELISCLEASFGPGCGISNTHTGLSFLFSPASGQSEEEITASALSIGLAIRGLDSYRLGPVPPSDRPTLVLGYGSLDEKSIPTAVGMLRKAVFGN